MPLIGYLSNPQFISELEKIRNADMGVGVHVRAAKLCRCGCGETVARNRKFVSQDHYNTWLSHVRYVGRNRRPDL